MTENRTEEEKNTASWADKPFTGPSGTSAQKTGENRSARALEYIAHQLWHIRQSLSSIEKGRSAPHGPPSEQP